MSRLGRPSDTLSQLKRTAQWSVSLATRPTSVVIVTPVFSPVIVEQAHRADYCDTSATMDVVGRGSCATTFDQIGEPVTADRFVKLSRFLMVLIGLSLAATALYTIDRLYVAYALSAFPSSPFAQTLNSLLVLGQSRARISGAFVFLLLTASVGFLAWVYAANRSLRTQHGPAMRFTPAMSVVWFFVPIANLVKPYEVVQEIWQVSRQNPSDEGRIVLWWWLATVAAPAVLPPLALAAPRQIAYWVVLAGPQVLMLIGGLLTLILVRNVSAACAGSAPPLPATLGSPRSQSVPAPPFEPTGNRPD